MFRKYTCTLLRRTTQFTVFHIHGGNHRLEQNTLKRILGSSLVNNSPTSRREPSFDSYTLADMPVGFAHVPVHVSSVLLMLWPHCLQEEADLQKRLCCFPRELSFRGILCVLYELTQLEHRHCLLVLHSQAAFCIAQRQSSLQATVIELSQPRTMSFAWDSHRPYSVLDLLSG